MSTMMGAEEADRVQGELATAMGALTRAKAILYPHAESIQFAKHAEASCSLKHVNRAMNEVEHASNDLDVA